jgi:hypothetical protein
MYNVFAIVLTSRQVELVMSPSPLQYPEEKDKKI